MPSNFLSLLFAPLFVLLIQYFELREVVLAYLVLASLYFFKILLEKKSYKDMLMSSIYVVALSIAYYFSSLDAVKYIPVTLSMIFLLLFMDSHLYKKEMILGFTRKFYSKKLSDAQIEFLKKGDIYWVFVMLVNTLIHLYVVNFSSDVIWAFYASIGWYILFFSALSIQIIYGKVYVSKVFSR